ncbi:MAG: helix-turn-helix domain-containing protein [Planctomycetota bacterium]|nr:helix-turn-helix domain-containing protein [Planctomycetota bacterium]
MLVTRFHYWRGVPKLHSACRHKGMAGERAAVMGDDYINGTELAKKLGIGRSTLNRWVRAGKLPKPVKGISGMLMFGRSDTAAALR